MLEQKINNVIKTLDEIKRLIEQVPAARLVEIDGQFSENYTPEESYVHVDEAIWFGGENDGDYTDSVAFLSVSPSLKDEETIISIEELAEALCEGREFLYIADFSPTVNINPFHRKENQFKTQISVIGNLYYHGSVTMKTKELITVRTYMSNHAVNPYRCCVWIESPDGQASGSAEAKFLMDAIVAALESCGVKFKGDLTGSFQKIVDALKELCDFMGAEYLFTSHANA